MMATRCMERASGAGAQQAPPSTGRGRRLGAGSEDRLVGQPAVEETALAFVRRLAADRADGAPAAPLQAPSAQRVGLEADQQMSAKAASPSQRWSRTAASCRSWNAPLMAT